MIKGSDFATSTSSSTDTHGHGTHIAGIIGALTDNTNGISGVNWDVTIMGVKTVGSAGKGTGTGFVEGVQYAVDNGAKILNLSFGGEQPCSQTPLFQDIITYANQKGVVVVAAAGNGKNDSGIGEDASNLWPASCQGTIVVGATTAQDTRATFSNFGSKVDISAPGSQILSTKSSICNPQVCSGGRVVANDYLLLSGTSMSAPLVSGVAALILARNPSLSPDQVKACIVKGGDVISTDLPIGPRLNALKALQECDGVEPAAIITPIPIPTSVLTPTLAPTSPPVPSPTPKSLPTPTVIIPELPVGGTAPTSAPAASKPSATKTPTPSPTPIHFGCYYNPSCRTNQGIQLCTLQCLQK
jgi:hypothetical protein